MGKMNLFDGCGDEDPNINDIKINHEYARRFVHNRQREAAHRLEELKKRDDDISDSYSDEESSSESDFEDDIPKRKEVKFFDVLSKIKNKDPILNNPDVKLFDSGSEDDEGLGEKKKEKKKKPKYLSQVLAEQLIKYGAEGLGSDEDGDDLVKSKVKSFDEEQQELVKAVLDATKEAEKDDDGDELLKVKVKEDVMDDENDDEEEQERIRKIDEALGEGENEDEMFLKNFFTKRMWVGGNDEEELDVDDVDDEEEVERQEEYEYAFNLRHEENAGDRVMGHSRFVEGSVRKKDTKRKEEKERQKMRREQLKAEKEEEVKHLKNLMKKEINKKIQMIQKVSGIKGMDASFVEGDFDPETHDEKMNKFYNDEYYKEEDPELGNELGNDSDEDDEEDIEKPDFDEEDKLLGLPDDWDMFNENPDSKDKKFYKEDHFLALPNKGDDEVNKSGRGFTEARQKVLKLKAEKGVDNEAEAAMKEIRDKCMEEYYGLEFEDVVGGDVKTRFRYRPVKPKRFGLSDTDILLADEKLLNQVVPLKKIAPYRETEWKVNRTKVLGVRKQIREIPKRKQTDAVVSGIKFNGTGEKRKTVAENPEVPQDNEGNGETSNPSRRAKRRRKNQSGLKLPHERLLAYGAIPPNHKKGKK